MTTLLCSCSQCPATNCKSLRKHAHIIYVKIEKFIEKKKEEDIFKFLLKTEIVHVGTRECFKAKIRKIIMYALA